MMDLTEQSSYLLMKLYLALIFFWQKYEVCLHKNMHIQFLHLFIFSDRHIYSKHQKKS